MATPKSSKVGAMLPYRKQGEIDYASLEFNADLKNVTEDAMLQNLELAEIIGLFRARFTDFNERPDVFLDNETFICYDPSNLNVRIAPDVYLAFGVEAEAIRPRKLFLPWEVGKPPDFAMEIASESTSLADVNRKPGIYAAIGVPEFWLFDPSGGRYYGQPIWGGELVNREYRELPQTREPDGVLKVYSPLLQVCICWDDSWPRLYDPATGAYDRNWRAEHAAAVAARDQRDAALAEVARLQEILRRRNEGSNGTQGAMPPC